MPLKINVVTVDGKEYVLTKSGALWPTPLPRRSYPNSPRKDTEDEDRMHPDVVNPDAFPVVDPVE